MLPLLVMLDIVLARLFRHSVADDRLRAAGLSRPTGLEGTRPTASDGLSRSAGLDGGIEASGLGGRRIYPMAILHRLELRERAGPPWGRMVKRSRCESEF